MRLDVRYGSLADVSSWIRHVRFTPESEHFVGALVVPYADRGVEPQRSIEREGDDVVATFERKAGVKK